MANELAKNAPFLSEKKKIQESTEARLAQSAEYGIIRDSLSDLEKLRKDGLYKTRQVSHDLDTLKADHNLDIVRTKKASKRSRQAYIRESKRQVTSLKFAIANEKQAIKQKTKKEFSREKSALIGLLSKVENPVQNPDTIRDFSDELPLTVKGLDLILEKKNSEAQACYDSASDVAELRKQLSDSRKNNGDPYLAADLEDKIGQAKARESYEKELNNRWKKILADWDSNENSKGKKYFAALGSLCRQAYLLREEDSLIRMNASHKADKEAILRRRKLDLTKLKLQAEKDLREVKESSEFSAKVSSLESDLAASENVEKKNEAEVKKTADRAWAALRKLFDAEISAAVAKRQAQRDELNAYLKDATENFKALDSGNKEKLAKDIEKLHDEVYLKLALSAVEENYLRSREDELARTISASLKKKKTVIDESEQLYYKQEEVITDPSLVDTSNIRLVIKNIPAAADVKAIEKRDRALHGISLFFIYLFLVFCAVMVLFPFYWMINTSLKSTEEIINSITPTFWPETVMWSNYVDVFQKFDFFTFLGNTLVVGICSTIGVLLTCILSAFAFARLKFKGRDTLFVIFLATMMIPGEMMVITNYITVANFGWIGSNAGRFQAYLSMIMPFLVSVFYIYLLRQNFKQIPEELYLAAKVDGKSDWSFLWRVMVPLCQPTLITIGILELMGSWNAYVWPNLVTNRDEYRLISNGLRSAFTTTTGYQEYGLQMAATVYVTLPLLLLFIFFRKYIMRGVGRAGIKG